MPSQIDAYLLYALEIYLTKLLQALLIFHYFLESILIRGKLIMATVL